MPDFDIKKFVHNYADKAAKERFKNMALGVNYGSLTDVAIMAFFDTNVDGIVTKEEFAAKSSSEFTTYMNSLFDYYEKEGIQEKHLKSEEYADRLKNLYNQKSFFGLGEVISNISIFADKNKTDQEDENNTYIKRLNNLDDEDSKVVDWHIGTFNQMSNRDCPLLAGICSMTEEELRELYVQKEDENGIYYEFNFPKDKRKKPIIVTEQELKDGIVNLKKGKVNVGCADGDPDAKLIEMAYLKRYGDKIARSGGTPGEILSNLYGKKPIHYTKSEQVIEAFRNKKHLITQLGDIKSLAWNYPYDKSTNCMTLPNGEIIKVLKNDEDKSMFSIQLPDGQIIYARHDYSVKSYDESGIVTIVNPHETSTNINIPIDTYLYLFLVY